MAITFLFGAGAECSKKTFGLPSGPDYTLRTMQQKQEKLYTELNKFYTANRLKEMEIKKYQNEFLFKKDSHTFREIIYRAALECIKNKCSGGLQYKDYVDMVAKHQRIKESDDKEEKRSRVRS